MLQGSADGDPAAPAGFAEALSFSRNEKSTLRGAFFMPEIQHSPCRSCRRAAIFCFWFLKTGSKDRSLGRLLHWVSGDHRQIRRLTRIRAQKKHPEGCFSLNDQAVTDPAHSATGPVCLPCRPESGCPDHDPCALCLPCHPASNARRNQQPCH